MGITAKRHDCTALLPTRGCPAYCSPLRWATARLALLLLALAVACLPSLAFAQTSYFWNGGDPTASPAAGGTGTWDSATGNWRQGSDTGTAVAWPAAGAGTDAAIFAGTAGTVTLSGTQTANQLGFDVTGYTLTGGTLALDGTAPAISVISGTATVGSAVSGSAGLVKTGDGTLVLSAANNFSGDTTISAGTLQLNAQAAASNGLITLGDAATGTSAVQLTLNTNIDRSGFTSAITVASLGTGTATIKWIETGTTSGSGNGTITLNRATTFDATQFSGGYFIFNHALAGSGEITLTSTNGTRFLLEIDSSGYTGDVTVQSGGIFEPRDKLSAATGNSITVNSGGELRTQFSSTTIGGLNGGGIVRPTAGGVITVTLGKGDASGSFSGVASGGLRLAKIGTGSQALSGANTYTGGTTVVAGTLQIGSTSGAGTGAITLGTADTGASDVQLTLGSNADRSGFGNAITVANQGTGTATIKWIETGTTSGSGNGTITLNRATTFDATQFSGGYFLFNRALSGSGDITLTGTNNTRFLLQAASSGYTGDITVQSGGIFEPRTMLSATSGNNLTIDSGGIAYFFGTSTIGALNGAGNVSRSAAGNGTISVGKGDASGSFSGSITTGVALVKTGTGTQVLSGASTTASAVTIVAGMLQIGSTSGAGSGGITLGTAATGSSDVQLTLGTNADRSGFGNAITVANQGTGTATIKWIETGTTSGSGNGTITLNRATTFDATQFSGGYFLFNRALSGSGDITLTGTNNTRFLLQAASSGYTGDITVQSGGIFEPRTHLSASTGNDVTVESGGELRIQFGTSAIGGLNGDGTVQSVDGSSTLSVGKANASGSFSGILRNNGAVLSLAKTGTGTQVLSGVNTYTGGTTINAGTLEAANNAALGTGNVTIANGATLRVAAGTSIANTLSLAGSTLELESPEALGTVAGLIAGTSATPASLTPTVAWGPQVAGTTYSDVLGLTNTAGTVQILEIAYDPATLGSIAPADLFLGWDDNGAWVNAIDGNSGSAGGSAVFNQTGSLTSLGILATSDYLGSWGRDTTANTVWAVIDHNSDFAAIAVPEPATLALAGVAAATLGLGFVRRRLRRPEVR